MGKWDLDYDGALFLKFSPDSLSEFSATAFYKLSLRRYVHEGIDGFMRFEPTLNYHDFLRIIDICKKETEKRQYELNIGEQLLDYIDERNTMIIARSSLGVEIKEKNPRYEEEYANYKEIVDNCMERQLRDEQMRDSFFMCFMKKSANFSVPGSGKTSSVLGAFAYLRSKEIIDKIVVICPKNAFGAWMDEFKLCFGSKLPMRCLSMQDPLLKNAAAKKTALKFDSGNANLILCNYEAIAGIADALHEVIDKKTLLIFDEVHRVKRIDGKRANYAVYLAKDASYVFVMTGTPIPNGYGDIYNFLHILFPDDYSEYFGFDKRDLKNPDSDEIEDINRKLQPFFCRTTKEQLGVPAANDDVFIEVNATKSESRILQILEMKYRKNKLPLFIRILQLESNPQLLLKAIDLNDYRYLVDDSADIQDIDILDCSGELEELIGSVHNTTKFNAAIKTVTEIVSQGKTLIVWCVLVDSIKRLAASLKKNGFSVKCIYGEVNQKERKDILDEVINGKIQVLITNPHTLAEAISLHHVCHDALYFEYSYNLVHLLQSKDRINRLGLLENQYTQYYFCKTDYKMGGNKWSMDEEVYNRLKMKESIMLEAIKQKKLEVMPTSEEDLKEIFHSLK